MHVFIRIKSLEQTCYQKTGVDVLGMKLFEQNERLFRSYHASKVCLLLRDGHPHEPIAKDEEEDNWFNIHLTHITPRSWHSSWKSERFKSN